MIFELLRDFADVMIVMPKGHERHRMLKLLEEAVRRDVFFIEHYPTTLFQCMWNSCWWYDCQEAARHFETPLESMCRPRPGVPPWSDSSPKLYAILDQWLNEKEHRTPKFFWLQSRRPPAESLGDQPHAVLIGHERGVAGAAFSPDGKTAISVGIDESLIVWDTFERRRVVSLNGRDDSSLLENVIGTRLDFVSFAVSPDGRWAATGCSSYETNEFTVRLCDIEEVREVVRLKGHRNLVRNVAFAPQGDWFASLDLNGVVKIWDVHKCQQVAELQSDGFASGLAISPDGSQLAVSSSVALSCGVTIWDVGRRKRVGTFGSFNTGVRELAWSQDGEKLAVVTQRGDLQILHTHNWKETQPRLEQSGLCAECVAFSPDGRQIAAGGRSHEVGVWDLRDGALKATFRGHRGHVSAVTFSPDSTRILSAGYHDHTIRIWSPKFIAGGTILADSQMPLTCLTLSSDGQYAVTGGEDGVLRSWDIIRGLPLCCRRWSEKAGLVAAFAPDSRHLAVAERSAGIGGVKVLDAKTGFEILALGQPNIDMDAVEFSADGRHVICYSTVPVHKVFHWSAPDWSLVSELRLPTQSTCVAISPDGTYLATGEVDGTVRVWDAATNAEIGMCLGNSGRIDAIRFVPDGRRLLSYSADGATRLWNIETAALLDVMPCTSDLSAIASGPERFRWRIRTLAFGLAVESNHTGETAGWYPGGFTHLTALPFSKGWSACSGHHFALFSLRQGRSVSDDHFPQEPIRVPLRIDLAEDSGWSGDCPVTCPHCGKTSLVAKASVQAVRQATAEFVTFGKPGLVPPSELWNDKRLRIDCSCCMSALIMNPLMVEEIDLEKYGERELIRKRHYLERTTEQVAIALYNEGRWDEALDHFRQQEELCRSLEEASRLRICLARQVELITSTGDLGTAFKVLCEIEALAAADGDELEVHRCRQIRGKMLMAALNNEAEMLRRTQDLAGLFQCLNRQVGVATEACLIDAVDPALLEMENLCRIFGDAERLAGVLYRRAVFGNSMGHSPDVVRRLCEEAIQLASITGQNELLDVVMSLAITL